MVTESKSGVGCSRHEDGFVAGRDAARAALEAAGGGAPALTIVYGTVLYGNDDPNREHPEDLDGYQDHTDDFTMEHIPGAGYYIAEEWPDVVVRRTLEFLSAR